MRQCVIGLLVFSIAMIYAPLHAASVDCTARSMAVDLRDCDLSHADLHGLDLSRANLSNAILTDANLTGTDLRHAILTGVTSGELRGQPQPLPLNPQSIKRVLFIGNSYTAVNNLPAIFSSLVTNMGIKAPTVVAVTPGGQNFAGHLTTAATQNAINAGNWDVVVLQNQSQEPAFAEIDSQHRTSMLQSAAELSRRIRLKSPNARIFFYETWARHAAYWRTNHARGEGTSPQEMQARLRKWYGIIALQNQASVVAVGDAWEYSYAQPNAPSLHASDYSHPTWAGSYLAGLMMYGTIYGSSHVAPTWYGTLTHTTAQQLINAANAILASNVPTGLPPGWYLHNGYLVGPGANLRNADLHDTNLAGIDLSDAVLINVVWRNTICPDGSNSDMHAAGCQSALATQTPTITASATRTARATASRTRTATATHTASRTRTATATPSTSRTSTSTRTSTATRTASHTRTATITHTATSTRTATITRTPTSTQTQTPTRTS